MLKIIILGRLPSLNDYVKACRYNKFAGAKMAKEAKIQCEFAMIEAKRKNIKFSAVDVSILWVEKNKRRDKDNISFARKFIFDALQSIGVLENDGWEQIRSIKERFEVDKENPRIEIMLVG